LVFVHVGYILALFFFTPLVSSRLPAGALVVGPSLNVARLRSGISADAFATRFASLRTPAVTAAFTHATLQRYAAHTISALGRLFHNTYRQFLRVLACAVYLLLVVYCTLLHTIPLPLRYAFVLVPLNRFPRYLFFAILYAGLFGWLPGSILRRTRFRIRALDAGHFARAEHRTNLPVATPDVAHVSFVPGLLARLPFGRPRLPVSSLPRLTRFSVAAFAAFCALFLPAHSCHGFVACYRTTVYLTHGP